MSRMSLAIEKARNMEFPELANAIRRDLSEIAAGAYSDRPERGIEDAMTLIEVLRERIPFPSSLPPSADWVALPAKPVPPAHVPPPHLPKVITTPEIAAIRAKIDPLLKELKYKLEGFMLSSKRKTSKKRIKELNREKEETILRLSLETFPPAFARDYERQRKAREQYLCALEEHEREMIAYKEFVQKNARKVSAWRVALIELERKRHPYEIIVNNLRRDLDGLRHPAVYRLPWHLLPPGGDGPHPLLVHIEERQRRFPEDEVDVARVRCALDLKPSFIYVGTEEFDGYFVFVFPTTNCVLLENPRKGNAAYIFFEDWMRLSRIPKLELLREHSDKVRRILHKDSSPWKQRIRRALKL